MSALFCPVKKIKIKSATPSNQTFRKQAVLSTASFEGEDHITIKINFTGQHVTAAVCTSALLILSLETVWMVHKKHRIPKAKEQQNGNDPSFIISEKAGWH